MQACGKSGPRCVQDRSRQAKHEIVFWLNCVISIQLAWNWHFKWKVAQRRLNLQNFRHPAVSRFSKHRFKWSFTSVYSAFIKRFIFKQHCHRVSGIWNLQISFAQQLHAILQWKTYSTEMDTRHVSITRREKGCSEMSLVPFGKRNALC